MFRIILDGNRHVMQEKVMEGLWRTTVSLLFPNEGKEGEVLWLRRLGARIQLAVRELQQAVVLPKDERARLRAPLTLSSFGDGVRISVDTVGVRPGDIFEVLPHGYVPMA